MSLRNTTSIEFSDSLSDRLSFGKLLSLSLIVLSLVFFALL